MSEGGGEIEWRTEVVDGVVDEYGIERAAEPYLPRVALHVMALGIEPAAHGQHLRRAVDESQRVVLLEVGGAIASSRAELEDVDRAAHLVEQAPAESGLLGVLVGRRHERPPLREFRVHPLRHRSLFDSGVDHAEHTVQ